MMHYSADSSNCLLNSIRLRRIALPLRRLFSQLRD